MVGFKKIKKRKKIKNRKILYWLFKKPTISTISAILPKKKQT